MTSEDSVLKLSCCCFLCTYLFTSQTLPPPPRPPSQSPYPHSLPFSSPPPHPTPGYSPQPQPWHTDAPNCAVSKLGFSYKRILGRLADRLRLELWCLLPPQGGRHRSSEKAGRKEAAALLRKTWCLRDYGSRTQLTGIQWQFCDSFVTWANFFFHCLGNISTNNF